VLEAGFAEQIDGVREVTAAIRIVPAPGHTPGHQCVEIASRGQRAVLAGDILHNPIEVLHPEWSPIFDDDKAAAMAQRRRFVETHCDADVTIFAAHFSGPTAGRIVSVGGRRIFRPLAV
jgi:glyoxylase-like metal-dependent hydrolase (beta-lactamase superfamily II)